MPLRVDVEQEALGLDVSQHGETAVGIETLAGAAPATWEKQVVDGVMPASASLGTA